MPTLAFHIQQNLDQVRALRSSPIMTPEAYMTLLKREDIAYATVDNLLKFAALCPDSRPGIHCKELADEIASALAPNR